MYSGLKSFKVLRVEKVLKVLRVEFLKKYLDDSLGGVSVP